MEVADLVENMLLIAQAYGWRCTSHDVPRETMTFRRKGVRLDIQYARMTVISTLTHPKDGTSQLIRKRVSLSLLEQIFDNPRVHTSVGYRVKKSTNRNRWE